jgi:hypothetical protein
MSSRFSHPHSHWLAFGVVVIGVSLRFLFLDADPYYYEWAGYITDEGRWVENARNLALFGELFDQYIPLHFYLGPLFQLANYVVFALGGVSLVTSRIFTALCGSAILVFFWGFLRRAATREAILLGLALLAFQADLVVLSRVAVPEMVIMFLQLLIYIIVTSNGSSPRRMLLAGLLLFVAMGMKLTMAPFLIIFSAIILFMPRQHSGGGGGIQAWRDLLTFWIGFAVPLLLAVLSWSIFAGASKSSLLWTLATIKNFLRLSTAYGAISFPFEHPFSLTVNIWALGLWLSALGWMTAGRDGTDFQSRRYLVTSAIWLTLYLSVMLLLWYFPTRYKVHILIPMAVNITVGISLLQRVTIREVIESFTKLKGPSRLLRVAILSLPTAAFISPLLASAVGMVSADPGRLRIKLASLVILLILTAYAVNRLKDSKHAMAFFLTFPLIAAAAWLMLNTSRASTYPFYPSADTQFHAAWWSLFLLGVSGVSLPLAKAVIGWGQIGCARYVTALAMFYMAISLVSVSPGYTDPRYSIKDASQDLGRLYSGPYQIFIMGAEGLFNNNSLRYRRLGDKPWNSEREEIVVVAFAYRQRLEDILAQKYRLVHSYDLYVSPEYYRLHPFTVSTFPRGKIVRVFKRREGTGE